MTPEILYEEAVSLARSSTLLKDEGLAKDLAAVWKADRTIKKDDENYVHRISIDCKYLSKDLGLKTGCISLYLGEDDASDLFSLHEPNLKLGQLIKESYGTPLYTQPTRSLPPLEAVMRFGSSQVEDWLNTIGFFRTDTDTPNTSEADDYIQLWIQEYPLYQDNIFAVIGGWHNPWPDGDWGELLDEKLIFWILQDAEPWFEVWETSHGLKILQRFT